MTDYIARLIGVTEVANVTDDIMPFVKFRGSLEKRELNGSETVAILHIEGTSSYAPVFTDSMTLGELESELEAQDARLNAESRQTLARHLKA